MLKQMFDTYGATRLAADAARALAGTGLVSSLSNFDKESLLNRAGLATYRPRTASSMSLFVLGAVAGGVAALLFATKTGPELRTQVRERALDLKDRAKEMVQRNSAQISERVGKLKDQSSSDVRI